MLIKKPLVPCRLVFQHWFRRSIVPEHPWLVALQSQSQPASTLSCFRYTRYTRRKLQEHWLASDHGAKYVTASDHADIPRQPICVQWISLKNTVLNRYTKVKIVLIIDFKTWHRDKNIKQFVILNWIMITFNYKTNFFARKPHYNVETQIHVVLLFIDCTQNTIILLIFIS